MQHAIQMYQVSSNPKSLDTRSASSYGDRKFLHTSICLPHDKVSIVLIESTMEKRENEKITCQLFYKKVSWWKLCSLGFRRVDQLHPRMNFKIRKSLRCFEHNKLFIFRKMVNYRNYPGPGRISPRPFKPRIHKGCLLRLFIRRVTVRISWLTWCMLGYWSWHLFILRCGK